MAAALHDPVRAPDETKQQYHARLRQSRAVALTHQRYAPSAAEGSSGGRGRKANAKARGTKGPRITAPARRVRERKHKKPGTPVIGAKRRLYDRFSQPEAR